MRGFWCPIASRATGAGRGGPSWQGRDTRQIAAQSGVAYDIGAKGLSVTSLNRPRVALADVRFAAHYGLTPDIAPSPKSAMSGRSFLLSPTGVPVRNVTPARGDGGLNSFWVRRAVPDFSQDQALRNFSSIVSRRPMSLEYSAIGWGRPTR